MEYAAAGEVKQLAQSVIDKWHPHLSGISIEYVFALEEIKNKGKLVLGRARKMSGLNSFLRSSDDEQFFVIEIWADGWRSMDQTARVALLDHELSHCKMEVKEGELRLFTVGHDLEEFNAVVERHGLWAPDVVLFANSINNAQPSLFEEKRKSLQSIVNESDSFNSITFKAGTGKDAKVLGKIEKQATA